MLVGSLWPWASPQHLHQSVKMEICCSKTILLPTGALWCFLPCWRVPKCGNMEPCLMPKHHGVIVPIDHFVLAQWWQSLLAMLIFHLIFGHFFHPIYFFSFHSCSWLPMGFEVLWLAENRAWRVLVGSSECCIPEASVGTTMAAVPLLHVQPGLYLSV